jgi:hypothetical protein
VAHCATGIERPLKLLALATLLSAALLSGLIPTIGVLILLTRGVLATLLAAVTLIVLAALLLATLVLLVLILVHQCLLGVFPLHME